ncbi:MAG: hypothetical protein AAF772_00270 [Acidobacteriota bacterium]
MPQRFSPSANSDGRPASTALFAQDGTAPHRSDPLFGSAASGADSTDPLASDGDDASLTPEARVAQLRASIEDVFLPIQHERRERLHADADQVRKRLGEIRTRTEAPEAMLARHRTRHDERTAALGDAEAQLDALRAEHSDDHPQTLRARFRVRELTRGLSELDGRIHTLESSLQAHRFDVRYAQNQLTRLDSSLQETETWITSLEAMGGALDGLAAAAEQGDVDALARLDALEADVLEIGRHGYLTHGGL